MKRRTWLLSAAGVGGAALIGWSVLPQRSRMGKPELMLPTTGDVALNGWIKINQDGSVTLAMPRSEMGQGVHTALAMLVAEELDMPLAKVKLEQAGADAIYGNVAMFVGSLPFHPLDMQEGHKTTVVKTGQWVVGKLSRELGVNATGGSSSIADAWEPLRLAAATARAQLVQAAAAQFKVAAADVRVQDGMVSAGGQTAHFGALASGAAGASVGDVKLKARADWHIIGKPAPRSDVPAKVNGTSQFGADLRPAGLLYAAVRMCPMLGGAPGAMNTAAALNLPGVQRVVQLASYGGSTAGFAVVGKSSWHAKQGALAVDVQWQQRAGGALNTADIEKTIAASATDDKGFAFYKNGDVAAVESLIAEQKRNAGTAGALALRVVDAQYSAPYLAHATMEPMNCTARVDAQGVEIWAPTQVPQMARRIAAQVAGVSEDKVTLHVTLLGGGFGRRLDVDFVAQAVRVAMDCGGKPVQILWSREEDTGHDFYRPAHAANLRGALDAKGDVSMLRIHSAGDAITPRWFERALPLLAGPVDAPDKTASEGLFDLPYAIPHQRMTHAATKSGVPVGYWRSVGHSHNAFFSESFIDELAHAAQTDPLAFRRKLLKDAPRYLAVLNLAADKVQWGAKLPAGHALGIALHESFGTIAAQVAQVSLGDKGLPRVHRVVCALDCGTAVNPQIIAQQVESAVIFGLTAALYGRIDIADGVVQQTNFAQYQMLKLAQAPVVHTHIVPSTYAPGGIGEPAVPPLAPAVGNALFALTGKRHRSLPFVA
jgi:isoquinoline 1-oxidoreductase subunit beta